jgi:hypothetical protein
MEHDLELNARLPDTPTTSIDAEEYGMALSWLLRRSSGFGGSPTLAESFGKRVERRVIDHSLFNCL